MHLIKVRGVVKWGVLEGKIFKYTENTLKKEGGVKK